VASRPIYIMLMGSSSTRLGVPRLPTALLCPDWNFDCSFSAVQSPLQPQFGPPLFHAGVFTYLLFRQCSAWMAAPLDRCSSTPISAPCPGFAFLDYIPCSSITINTPIAFLHSTSCTPPFLLMHLFFLQIYLIAFQPPF